MATHTPNEPNHDDQQVDPPRHPRLALDEIIHQPVRLSIMAILMHNKKVDFAFLRDQLEVGDSNLSRHLTALEEAEYIIITKVFEGKRPRTWLALNPTGRTAFARHVQALQQIVAQPLPLDGGNKQR